MPPSTGNDHAKQGGEKICRGVKVRVKLTGFKKVQEELMFKSNWKEEWRYKSIWQNKSQSTRGYKENQGTRRVKLTKQVVWQCGGLQVIFHQMMHNVCFDAPDELEWKHWRHIEKILTIYWENMVKIFQASSAYNSSSPSQVLAARWFLLRYIYL